MSSFITACNSSQEKDNIDITEISREVAITDKNSLYNELISYINGSAVPTNFILDNNDIIPNIKVNNYYYFNGSIYIQIDNYMYRFQLNNDNKVMSYIKYTLEA